MKKVITLFFLIYFSLNISAQQCPDNVNDPGVVGWGSYDAHRVECAWELTHGSSDVVVAVVDVFSSQLHEDLQGKIESIDEIVPMNAEWLECHHGISVAGTIAAIPNNGTAVAGFGFDTEVALYNVATDCDGTFPGLLSTGFTRAVNDGHQIINFSWQGGLAGSVQEVQDYIDAGGVLITAGGDANHIQIADIPGVINVGRVRFIDGVGWRHSNYLTEAVDQSLEIYGYAFGLNRLAEFDTYQLSGGGTSSAAPMIAGAVALMRAENPALTPAEVECIIQMSARSFVVDAPEDAFARLLDVEAAVEMAQNWPTIPLGEKLEFTGTQTIGNISATGHIVIKTGADITVTDNITMAHTEGRIFIERGARLNVLGATVETGMCNEEWRGFLVEGNANRVQPDPYGVLQPEDAGVLLLDNAQIFHASNAVSMHNKHKYPRADYMGGVVIANNGTTFTDNGRSFEFMRYDLGETSSITGCFFINNTKNVITAWRDHGLTISDNTFVDYERDGIFNATSVYEATGNTFIGSGTLGTIDFVHQNVGININNGSMIDQPYTINNNNFTLNHFAIKFDGTDGSNDLPSEFSNNISNGDDFGIFGQGSDHFRIRDNVISDESTGIIIFNSGTSDSEVHNNNIAAGFSGMTVVNQNDLFLFYRNCFENMPNTNQVNDFELIRVEVPVDQVSISPIQAISDGVQTIAPDNCFQTLSQDIINGAEVDVQGVNDPNPGEPDPDDENFIPDDLFRYGKDMTLPNADCRVARPDRLYDDLDLSTEHPGCDPNAPPGIPTHFAPIYCNVPEGKTELENERTSLLNQIVGLEALPHLNFAQLQLLRKLKRCLGKVEAKLAKILINDQTFNDLNTKLGAAELPFTRVAVVSALIDAEAYIAASDYMNVLNDNTTEWQDYVASQEILIRLLSDFDNFSLQIGDEDLLTEAGKKSNYYSAFIRGVYAEVFGASIHVDFVTDRSNKTRNYKKENRPAYYRISPNPAASMLTITGGTQPLKKVVVYDISGKIMHEVSDISGKEHILDIAEYPKGLYIVTILSSNGEIHSEKLIKM